jgi:NADH-quinone oxidoreductase subunit G
MGHAGRAAVYPAGGEAALAQSLLAASGGEQVEEAESKTGLSQEALAAAVGRLKEAKNAVIVYGAFMLSSREACAAVAALAQRTGAKLMALGPMANAYGLQAIGILPGKAGLSYRDMLSGSAKALILSGLDPAQDASLREGLADPDLPGLELLVVHDAFLTETAKLAHVVLPAKTGYEKEGTTVNLEGRFLRTQPAPVDAGTSEDFMGVVKWLGEALGRRMDGRSVRSAHRKLKKTLGVDLSELPPEGAFVKIEAVKVEAVEVKAAKPPRRGKGKRSSGNLLLVPKMARPERLGRNPHLRAVYGDPALVLHPKDARAHELAAGDGVRVSVAGFERLARVRLDAGQPEGLMLLPALPDQPAGMCEIDLAGDLVRIEPLPPPPLPQEDLPDSRLLSGTGVSGAGK